MDPTDEVYYVSKKNIIEKDLSNFEPIICGTQQKGIRGGTENVAYIAGARKALQYITENKKEMEEKIRMIRRTILEEFDNYFRYVDYHRIDGDEKWIQFCKIKNNEDDQIYFTILGCPDRCIPNTLMISFLHPNKFICNRRLIYDLDKKYGMIVSFGSACDASSQTAMHTLQKKGINSPDYVKSGAIRISLALYNTKKSCKQLIKNIHNILIGQIKEQI